MKKFFFLAIAATALASCSSDELVELKEGDEIKFTAVADNDSRAETVFCNNNLPADFQLYAATNATPAVNFIVDFVLCLKNRYNINIIRCRYFM